MDKLTKVEYSVIGVVLVMLVIGVVKSGGYARQERRDGLVRAELRQLKTDVEMYYNDHDQYPLTWPVAKYRYVVVEGDENEASGWYVSGALENIQTPDSGFNEEYNIEWRVTEEGNYEICGGNHSCLK